MAWTDKMVEELKSLWQTGLTTSEIAKQLGVSKNSIVGKVHRLSLCGRPSPIKKKEEVKDSSVGYTGVLFVEGDEICKRLRSVVVGR